MKILNLLLLLFVLSCNATDQKENKANEDHTDNLRETFYTSYLNKIVKNSEGAGIQVYYSGSSSADLHEVVTDRLKYGRDSLTLEEKALIMEILKQTNGGEAKKLLS